jgi:hypothetical protein
MSNENEMLQQILYGSANRGGYEKPKIIITVENNVTQQKWFVPIDIKPETEIKKELRTALENILTKMVPNV